MNTTMFSRMMLGALVLLCSCTTSQHSWIFSSEYENISSRLQAKAQNTTKELAPRRVGDSWQAEGEYEFDSGLNSTLEVVRSCVPPEYGHIGEAMEELNYARPEHGDTFYLTIRLIPDGVSKTKVRLLLKSLPS
jgi:hypothetical protein